MSPDTLDTRVVQLLLQDAIATLGESARTPALLLAEHFVDNAHQQMQPVEARDGWPASDGVSLAEAQRFFDRELVDHFQQDVHDSFWDTTWPACPRHPNHPLWYREEQMAWCCPRDGAVIAALGNLGASLRPPLDEES